MQTRDQGPNSGALELQAEQPDEKAPAQSADTPPAHSRLHLPWHIFVASGCVHLAITWSLDGIPAARGEPWALRWMRALAEHPVRGPLGLAMAWLGARALLRAALNRPPHS